ncbi:MAG: M28 family peptidase [Pricia sp.]|nr:M28 family peptidase [Pricia sp.]
MRNYLLGILALLFTGCNTNTASHTEITVGQSTIGQHIERLASDEFLGRKPFSEGEVKTVNYLKEEFAKLGLSPGNGDSYFQEVPMIEITGTTSQQITITGTQENLELDYFKDFMAVSKRTDSVVNLENSELVYAGYGIVAPEYGWNDYEGVDWKGKTAVVLVNDPGFQSGDSTLFKGNEMTYYGRWTYKYEEAARQGADGILIIHETEPASYGWNVIQSGWSGSQLILESKVPVVKIQGWISNESADRLIELSPLKGKNYKEMARSKDFNPVPLGLRTSIEVSNTVKRNVSKNVAALLPGSERQDEYILYSAHWDHFGIGRPINNDSIYNGAVDNASGTACLLAIAEAFKKVDQQKRSIVFIAVTAEEQGLLGSAYYAEHPIYEPQRTVANINMDAFKSPGPMKDLTITGYGQSEMDRYAEEAAKKQGRYVIPDPEPEKGYFFRSDHFNFAKIGIPALYADGSYEGFEVSADSIKKLNDYYRTNIYHQPADEYDPNTTVLSGIQFDAQLLFEVGLKLANEDYFPKWNEGSEFKAARN